MMVTGIVRRVDDLGRIVIPKEIRRRMGVEEGTPLEMFIDPTTNDLIFRKYGSREDIQRDIKEIFDTYDRNDIVAVIKEYLEKA